MFGQFGSMFLVVESNKIVMLIMLVIKLVVGAANNFAFARSVQNWCNLSGHGVSIVDYTSLKHSPMYCQEVLQHIGPFSDET